MLRPLINHLRRYLLLVTLPLLLNSCSHHPTQLSQSIHSNPCADTAGPGDREELRGMITQRSYLPALERMIGKEGRCPPDQALTTEYLAALNGLIDDGRINLQQGRYKEAGASLGRVYDSLQREKERLPSVSSSRLQRDMDVCAERLMREGLKEYRQGNLEQAIGIWQQIIRFQPGHREARRSIRTARVQLTNLEHFETRP